MILWVGKTLSKYKQYPCQRIHTGTLQVEVGTLDAGAMPWPGRKVDGARQLGVWDKAVFRNLDSRQALTGPRVAWPGAVASPVSDKSDSGPTVGSERLDGDLWSQPGLPASQLRERGPEKPTPQSDRAGPEQDPAWRPRPLHQRSLPGTSPSATMKWATARYSCT